MWSKEIRKSLTTTIGRVTQILSTFKSTLVSNQSSPPSDKNHEVEPQTLPYQVFIQQIQTQCSMHQQVMNPNTQHKKVLPLHNHQKFRLLHIPIYSKILHNYLNSASLYSLAMLYSGNPSGTASKPQYTMTHLSLETEAKLPVVITPRQCSESHHWTPTYQFKL